MSTSWFPAVQLPYMETGHGTPSDFDSWLTAGLSAALDPVVNRPTVPPARFAAPASQPAGGRVVRGVVLAASSLAALSAITAMAATGSPNPQVWGRQVSAAVETCKQQLKPGQHGIGACVSAFAHRDHDAVSAGEGRGAAGARESAEPEATKKPDTTSDHPSGRPSGTEGPASTNGNGHAYGRTDQATPPGHAVDKATPPSPASDSGTPQGHAGEKGTPPGEGRIKATPPGQLKVKSTPPGQLK